VCVVGVGECCVANPARPSPIVLSQPSSTRVYVTVDVDYYVYVTANLTLSEWSDKVAADVVATAAVPSSQFVVQGFYPG
jgi:hypothetical protein